MNRHSPDPGEDCEGVEQLLRVLTPAPVPSGLQHELAKQMEQNRRRSNRAHQWLAAAAALLAGAALFTSRQQWQAEKKADASVPAAATGNASDAGALASEHVEETTEVIDLEDAGTTPLHDGAYRIVRVTFLHRIRDAAGGNPAGRILLERTSQGYMALPLEIF